MVWASVRLSPPAKAALAVASVASPSFSEAVSFRAGNHTSFVATGDFNEDGIIDLAVTNESSSNVSIFLGDGHGGLGAASNYNLTPNGSLFLAPRSIAIGDFNGDKHLDFVTANSNNEAESITLRLGDGHGNFGALSTFPVGKHTFFVVTGDFNIDGKLDVAAASEGGNFLQGEGPMIYFPGTVSVLSGDGAGKLSAPQVVISYPKPLVPTSLAVGDFNKDGAPDLVVTTNDRFFPPNNPDQSVEPGTVSVLLCQGADGLGAAHDVPVAGGSASGVGPAFVVVRDFNEDDNPDLAIASRYSNTVSLLLGNGAGSFGIAKSFPAAAFSERGSLAAGDFNGDGDLDLVEIDGASITIIPGEGLGNFGAPINYPSYYYKFMTVADFNGDRKPDLALADTFSDTSNYVTILLNTSNFQPTPIATTGPQLLTKENTERAIALDSVTLKRDPFPVCASNNFSLDGRTRVILFALGAELTVGEDASFLTAQAEDAQHKTYPLTIEFVGKVPNLEGVTEIIVKLPDTIKDAGNVWMSINVRGTASNKALVRIEPSDCPPA